MSDKHYEVSWEEEVSTFRIYGPAKPHRTGGTERDIISSFEEEGHALEVSKELNALLRENEELKAAVVRKNAVIEERMLEKEIIEGWLKERTKLYDKQSAELSELKNALKEHVELMNNVDDDTMDGQFKTRQSLDKLQALSKYSESKQQ